MAISNDFENFINNLKQTNMDDMLTSTGEIAKKLNNYYYDLKGDSISNMFIVGSVGRETAIKGVSDLDLLFDLPSEVYTKFNNYESNGQSQLLQEVKNVLLERYPKTDISGDGQVVVINFSNFTVELVPGFKQSDDSFKYPDTHDGGKWKITNPLPEIETSKDTAQTTKNNFKYIANMLRAWKNEQGFKFGGLLIDTLVYNFLNENSQYNDISFDDYLGMTKDLFNFLQSQDKDQSYWFALGSNQHVYNSDNGKFVTKAKKAYNKLKDLDEDSTILNDELIEIFGSSFPTNENITENARAYNSRNLYQSSEEFIENKFPVDIRYNLKIDCKVTQNGFRPFLLSKLLKSNMYLRLHKNLEFEIVENDVNPPYDIYWKVKNTGEIAIQKNCVRGKIFKTNKTFQNETSDFQGNHFVECYIIKNGVCVAKSHLNVPLSNYDYIMG